MNIPRAVPFGPIGAAGCSHGWSGGAAQPADAQPVEVDAQIDSRPGGAEESPPAPQALFLCPFGAGDIHAPPSHGFRPRSAGSTRGYTPSSLRDENAGPPARQHSPP
ncbi:MAG: hypothetical protein ACK5V0_05545 [Alphaproteobacteria bacterium]